jgi:hypothetical protein
MHDWMSDDNGWYVATSGQTQSPQYSLGALFEVHQGEVPGANEFESKSCFLHQHHESQPIDMYLLPDSLEVGTSSSRGRGLFASDNLRQGT